ncbi:MAG: alpha/beta hydrolase [Gammaproteobacteria bacterium]|nr:MAG: alpha/beta hydrolase [Gammaproteobacteria bacterium]RLA52771.1 MAG: alpha/beta hydrolase [Gammaproteobacteria bacterium]
MTEISSNKIKAGDIEFHYLEAGSGPLVLCLHGFPDNAETYRYLMPVLANAGYHVVAPFMRGYWPTGFSPDGRYDSALLGLDVAALIDELGGGHAAAVIGHDWGAFATYSAAAFVPEKIDKIVSIAIAHPGALLGQLGLNYDVIKGGWHAYFFQMPGAEKAVEHNDYDFLLRWWQDASPEYDIPQDIIDSVKNTFRHEGTVEAALNYYRHTFNPAGRDPKLADLNEKVMAPTTVPCLAFHGTRDRPGRLETFDNMDELFTGGLEKVVLEGTGHFLHLEKPDEVSAKILFFLQNQG